MIDTDLIFLLIYEEHEFVNLGDEYSPTPSGYTQKKEIIKTYVTKVEMDKFIEENIIGRSSIYSYKTFHCFPTSKKIELNEFREFRRVF